MLCSYRELQYEARGGNIVSIQTLSALLQVSLGRPARLSVCLRRRCQMKRTGQWARARGRADARDINGAEKR